MKENSYNVFISYKATDNKTPTPDSVIAEELYYSLSACEGIIPFWDRSELVNVEGRSDYGMSIYSALDSAKVFIFICTKAAYMSTNYVESEWSTYLAELNSGRKPRGSIYGITVNVESEELPLGLRKFEKLSYSKENIKVIVAFVSNRLRAYQPDEKRQILRWKRERCEQILNRLSFVDFNARQFVDDFLSQDGKQVACISISDDYANSTVLIAEAIRLNQSFGVFFFYSLSEAVQVLRSDRLEKNLRLDGKEPLAFIETPITIRDVKNFNRLASSNPCRFIILARGHIPALQGEQTFWTQISPADEHELITLTKSLCRENNIENAKILIDKLLLPSNKCLRKPTILVLTVEYLSLYGSNLLESPGVTLLEILDNILMDRYPDAESGMDDIVKAYFQNKLNHFFFNEISNGNSLATELEKMGIVECKRGTFCFVLLEYLQYKVAEYALRECGPDSVKRLIECRLDDCVPICEYLLSERYGRFISNVALNQLSPENKRMMLSLFLDSTSFPTVVDLLDSEQVLSATLIGYVNEGNYAVVRHTLNRLESVHPEISNKPWVKVLRMMLDYQIDGVFHDCGYQDIIEYSIYKGTIEYYRDEYTQAIESFEHALTMTYDETSMCRLLLLFSDVLVDGGFTNRLQELLTKYYDIFSKMINYERYFIYRGNISLDQLDLLDAREYYMEALRKLQRNFNSSLLARVYGNLGLVDYYLGNMVSARRYFLKNEDLSIDTDSNANGIAISRVYLGQTYLFEGDFQRAFMYFSAAMFYARKAQNFWRIFQIQMLCDQFYPDFCSRVGEHIHNIESIRSSRYHAEMFLLLAECMLRTGCVREDILNVLDRSLEAAGNESRLFAETASLYRRLLTDQDDGRNISFLGKYSAWIRKQFREYLNGEKPVIEIAGARLPFSYYRELESERLKFCHISKKDCVDIFTFASRIQPTKYVLWERHESALASATYIENLLHQEPLDDDYMLWTIVEKSSQNVIGTIDLRYVDEYGGVEIGIILSDFSWRKHFATESLQCICQFAHSVLGLQEIYGVCVNGNKASEQMLRKNGFVFVRRIPNYHNIQFLPDKDGLMFKKTLLP